MSDVFKTCPRAPRLMAAAVGLLLALAGGCGYDSAEFGGADGEGYYEDGELAEALVDLSEHRVDEARTHYETALDEPEPAPDAYVGRGLTNLMLLAGSEPVTDLLATHFEVDSGIEANEAIYAEEGYFYWLVRGVSWEDDGEYSGIATHIADHVPFEADRIATLESFFTGVDAEADQVADDLVEVADLLGDVERDLAAATESTMFDAYYLPGSTFHADQLDSGDNYDLLLTRADVHQIAALVEAFRGAIYMVAAYENNWTLEEAFAPEARAEGDDTDDQDGSPTLRRALEFVDPYLGRQVDQADYLDEARSAFDSALSHFASAIETGLEQRGESTFEWGATDEDQARRLAAFAEALRGALDERTDLPHTSPEMSADFSPIFDGERTLEEDIAWFERSDDSDESLRLTDEALQAFLVDDLIDPGFAVGEDQPDWPIERDRLENFYDDVFGRLVNSIENAFFSTR